MPGNPLVRFDEGRVGRTARCRPLSYSTAFASYRFVPPDRTVLERSLAFGRCHRMRELLGKSREPRKDMLAADERR